MRCWKVLSCDLCWEVLKRTSVALPAWIPGCSLLCVVCPACRHACCPGLVAYACPASSGGGRFLHSAEHWSTTTLHLADRLVAYSRCVTPRGFERARHAGFCLSPFFGYCLGVVCRTVSKGAVASQFIPLLVAPLHICGRCCCTQRPERQELSASKGLRGRLWWQLLCMVADSTLRGALTL